MYANEIWWVCQKRSKEKEKDGDKKLGHYLKRAFNAMAKLEEYVDIAVSYRVSLVVSCMHGPIPGLWLAVFLTYL